MKSRKLADAQELVNKANGDIKVQKMIGKKPPAAKKGRPAAKAATKAKAKAKGKSKKVADEDQEVEQHEDPSGEGGDDAAGEGAGDAVGGKSTEPDPSSTEPSVKPDAPDHAAEWKLIDSWHIDLTMCFFFKHELPFKSSSMSVQLV
eukprot:s4489_g5.t1